jgi:hypothetical protein
MPMPVNELSGPALAATATAITAFVTSSISFVTLTLTKELKTSEFRQAWIDGLREDLARFFGASRAFARAAEGVQVHGTEYKSAPLTFGDEKISEVRYQAAETFSKVKLRLNPKEPEHVELLRLMRRAIDEQNSMLKGQTSVDVVLTAIEVANDFAPSVLKREWERVKDGERSFRIARNVFVSVAIATLVGFIVLLWSGKFGI